MQEDEGSGIKCRAYERHIRRKNEQMDDIYGGRTSKWTTYKITEQKRRKKIKTR